MKYRCALEVATLFAAIASATLCDTGSTLYDGNYYCQQVYAITYTGVGGAGSYSQITDMDSESGTCSSMPFGYAGSMSPLNEEVSLHFRGPISLKQFAAYTPAEASVKKHRRQEHLRRHAHHHAHQPRKLHERQVGATVTATINGQVVTWINEYSGPPDTSSISGTEPTSDTATTTVTSTQPACEPIPGSAQPIPGHASASGESSAPLTGSTKGWGRQGYYNAAQNTAEGLVFLNHYGGQGSGVFDYYFGSSLSYSSTDGQTGASSPQVLADITLPSSAEVVIMTDQQCGSEGNTCGYYRPGTVAYHGFNGAEKAFLMEFDMPNMGGTATNIYDPVNMPAIWMLNAQIPRTVQYGSANCSCWETGCGEFDIFEILTPGYHKAKSTLHGNIAGGSSDWFQRPEDASIKVGVVLYNNNIHVKILDDDQPFPTTMDSNVIEEIVDSTMAQSESRLVSLFSLSGASSG